MKKKEAITVRLDPEIYDHFRQYCYENHQSMTGAITQLILRLETKDETRWNQQED